MKITIWGARGSVPVSGEQYLRYGGDTSCIEIRSSCGDCVLIDAGTGIRNAGNSLVAERNRSFSIIFTHAHLDHLIGFPFLKPIYSSDTTIDIYGCSFTDDHIRAIILKPMSPPYFPVKYSDIAANIVFHDICQDEFSIGDLSFRPIFLSHPNRGLGFRITEGERSFVYLTDNELTYRHPGGLVYEDYRDFCSGADLLIHDAEFTAEDYMRTKTWGHSVYTDAFRLAVDARVNRFGLFHHNQDRSDDDIDAMVEELRETAEKENLSLDIFAAAQRMEIDV